MDFLALSMPVAMVVMIFTRTIIIQQLVNAHKDDHTADHYLIKPPDQLQHPIVENLCALEIFFGALHHECLVRIVRPVMGSSGPELCFQSVGMHPATGKFFSQFPNFY